MQKCWTEKYKPKQLTDFSYKNNAHLNALKWLKNWNKKTNFLVLIGQSGIGKTALVHTISRIYGYNVIEYNGGDDKTLEQARTLLLQSKTTSFNNKKKLFLIDDVEGFGDKAFYEKIFENHCKIASPIVFCANNLYDGVLYKYKQFCNIVYLNLTTKDFTEAITRIIIAEEIKIDSKAINALVSNCNYDQRAATNSLQIVKQKNKQYITEKQLSKYNFYNKNLFKTCTEIFKNNFGQNKLLFEKFSSIYKLHEEKLFMLCFENYPKYCRMFRYFGDIQQVNYECNIYPEQYKFLSLYVYNQKCKTHDLVELQSAKKQINLERVLPFCKLENKKKISYLIINKYFYYETLPYIQHFIKLFINSNGEMINLQLQEIKKYYYNFVDFHYRNLLDSLKDINLHANQNVKFLVKKEFKYKYKEGSSSAGRMDVGISELFN
ncbi:Chromosome transmission fidelity protein 18 [Conglomerata obtusa]